MKTMNIRVFCIIHFYVLICKFGILYITNVRCIIIIIFFLIAYFHLYALV